MYSISNERVNSVIGRILHLLRSCMKPRTVELLTLSHHFMTATVKEDKRLKELAVTCGGDIQKIDLGELDVLLAEIDKAASEEVARVE
jgi:hypothetical protein